MTPSEEFKNRFEHYTVHNDLLDVDELAYFTRELDIDALTPAERSFVQASRDALDQGVAGSENALEAAIRLNDELQKTKSMLEQQREELQRSYDRLGAQNHELERRNDELLAVQEWLERAKKKADEGYEKALDELRLQSQMNFLGERLKGQQSLLSWQNWMGSSVVIGTGFLFWITGDDIIAGAFVTLSSMFLQTMASNFAGFFGSSRDSQQSLQPVRPAEQQAPPRAPGNK